MMTNEPTIFFAATAEPTISITAEPSVALTLEPTQRITEEPTRRVTDEPTEFPQTVAPTITPTQLTLDPTATLTSIPTVAPSLGPTSAPSQLASMEPTTSVAPTTSEPTPSASVLVFPLLEFSAQFFPKTTLDFVEMESLIENFLRSFLSTNAAYADSFVSLVLRSDTNYNKETGNAVISSGGSAVFRGLEQPTQNELKEILVTYFSFWGGKCIYSEEVRKWKDI